MLRSIDYSGLIYPVNPHDVAAFKSSRRDHFGYSTLRLMGTTVLVASGIAFLILVVSGPILSALGSSFLAAFVNGEGAAALPSLFITLAVAFAFLAVIGGSIYVAIRSWRRSGGPWQRFYRMNKFAEDNELSFTPLDYDSPYPGLIFSQGDSRTIRHRFTSAAGRTLDYGNYEYSTGSGKSKTTQKWGFLALELDRALPHMVLDAAANNQLFGVSNLPQAFAKNQVLKLEGDFNSHFTLYCPTAYERDALYVFTPDLMALLIDKAAPFDVEVVDKWLLVYSPKPFDLIDPAVHRRLLGIADTVGTKALRQSRNYADDTIGDRSVNLVAPRGQRLRSGIPQATLITAAVFALIFGGQLLLRMTG
ncbi:hypothetical protein ESZ53_00435 [Salinibacterium sp. UTAS2018]|uniref:hypothetical protein n=1 Tax=Salinibacterium sp. UTAS2018 TaxID=2508880 RepID=UPI0010096CFC|nr:hypothetical protein [Salinibacterium sp. UTAS2018]QAV69041.1 hypothetical protein ESZ53_00435 [Salinibacterium sp. UTAS2018]